MSTNDLARSLDLMTNPGRLAVCRADGKPLISTMMWARFEFYCLECGRKYGYLDPAGVKHDEEAEAAYQKVKAEWDELSAGIMPEGRFWRKDCPLCTGEAHLDHASAEEVEANKAARERLRARVR